MFGQLIIDIINSEGAFCYRNVLALCHGCGSRMEARAWTTPIKRTLPGVGRMPPATITIDVQPWYAYVCPRCD